MRRRLPGSALEAADFAVREVLNDGSTVTIRAIRPDDKERVVRMFAALEPHSITARFFHHKKQLSEQELRQLTEIDHVRAVALVATIGAPAEESIIGLGR